MLIHLQLKTQNSTKIITELIAQIQQLYEGFASYEEMCDRLDITYLTEGTSSFRNIDDNSIDIIISQAVFRTCKKKEFELFMNEMEYPKKVQ